MCRACVYFVDQNISPGLVPSRLKVLPTWREFFIVVLNAEWYIALTFIVRAEEATVPV
jgi:hypothetical protein